MAEKGVYKRFLRERKKSVKADVVNARKEYEGIMSYLQDLMQEVLLRNVNEHWHLYVVLIFTYFNLLVWHTCILLS